MSWTFWFKFPIITTADLLGHLVYEDFKFELKTKSDVILWSVCKWWGSGRCSSPKATNHKPSSILFRWSTVPTSCWCIVGPISFISFTFFTFYFSFLHWTLVCLAFYFDPRLIQPQITPRSRSEQKMLLLLLMIKTVRRIWRREHFVNKWPGMTLPVSTSHPNRQSCISMKASIFRATAG